MSFLEQMREFLINSLEREKSLKINGENISKLKMMKKIKITMGFDGIIDIIIKNQNELLFNDIILESIVFENF